MEVPKEYQDAMLDWDKPIMAQPEIMKNLPERLKQRIATMVDAQGADNVTGKEFHDYILKDYVNQDLGIQGHGKFEPAMSQVLMDAGIPGVRYLDAMSRQAGEGSSNMVLFSKDIVRVIERNGEQINKPRQSSLPEARQRQILDKMKKRYDSDMEGVRKLQEVTKDVEVGVANQKKKVSEWHRMQAEKDEMVKEFTKNPPKAKTKAQVETERKAMAGGGLKDMMGP
jgi:hypothetical protein